MIYPRRKLWERCMAAARLGVYKAWLILLCLLVLDVCFGPRAHAQTACSVTTSDRTQFVQMCAIHHEYCTGINAWKYNCQTGSCTWNGAQWPACIMVDVRNTPPTHVFQSPFALVGGCPSAGTQGPSIESVGGGIPEGGACHNGCGLESASPRACVETVAFGRTETICREETDYTGDLCIPGSQSPEVDPSDEAESCEGSTCITVENSPPQVCLSLGGQQICAPVEIPTQAGCNAGASGAICVSSGSGTQPPYPPSPPYPANPQQPPIGTGTSSANGNPGANWAAYGSPEPGDTCPPENPDCVNNPGGTGGNGGTGTCDPAVETCDPEGDERTASTGTCGSEETPPQCSGDEIDCAVLHNAWRIRCALTGEALERSSYMASDDFAEVGGIATVLDDQFGNGIAAGELSQTRFGGTVGGSSSCPMLPDVTLPNGTVVPSITAHCELGWFRYAMLAFAWIVAARIVGRAVTGG